MRRIALFLSVGATVMLLASATIAQGNSGNVEFCEGICINPDDIGACVAFFGASDRAAAKNASYGESCPAYTDVLVLAECAPNLPSTKDFCKCIAETGDCALGGCVAAQAAASQAQRHNSPFLCQCFGVCL